MNKTSLYSLLLLIIGNLSWAEASPYGFSGTLHLPNKCVSDKCLKSILGVSSKISLQGGVCADDPLTFYQTSTHVVGDFDSFEFSKHCSATQIDQKLFDSPPKQFSCRSSSTLLISGATYVKIRNLLLDSKSTTDEEDLVPSRIYIYKCTAGCANKPTKIMYMVGDCG